MDANNTKFHLLHGERDWLPVLVDQTHADAWWDRSRQSITLAPIVQTLDELDQNQFLEPSQRRGAAFDHYGNTYWINQNEDGIVYQPAITPQKRGEFWHVDDLVSCVNKDEGHGDFQSEHGDQQISKPGLRGLTITTEGFLVAGTLEPSGVLVFDLHGGGTPEWLRWPEAVSFTPFDMSCTPDGGLWILGRDDSDEDSSVWRFDKNFKLLEQNGDELSFQATPSHDFRSVGATAEPSANTITFNTGINLSDSSPALVSKPIAIESLSNDAFILLSTSSNDEASIVSYFNNSELQDSVSLNEDVIGDLLAESAISAHDFAFLPGLAQPSRVATGTLYLASVSSTQSFELALRASNDELTLVMQPSLLPMRAYAGRALIVSSNSAFYDFGERWLPLSEQPLLRFGSNAQISGVIKDGVDADCVWHRLILDACIPAGTKITFESRAANEVQTLQELPWQLEPSPSLRSSGSELPLHQAFNELNVDSGANGSWDLLLQNAVGRYIELRITLTGNQRSTPRLQSLRVYYPRYSYLNRYLPAVYRENQESAHFLDRFLANVEGIFTSLEDKIAHAQSLFDTRSTPPEFLDWLGGWLGAFMDPSWDEDRKRLFIDNAYLLFRWRGTQLGLTTIIELTISECSDESVFEPLIHGVLPSDNAFAAKNVRIVENFLKRSVVGLVSDEVNQATSLRLESADTRWQPAMGARVLHQRYQQFLSTMYGAEQHISSLNQAWESNYTAFSEIEFPALMPQQSAQRHNWQTFIRDYLGFVYAHVTTNDEALYQEFLARRYGQITKHNSAYGLIGEFGLADFTEASLPSELPRNTIELTDWIEFVSIVLPIKEQAHRFTVLLPTQLGELPSVMQQRRAQVEELVQREKPAHTEFEVTFFWALFQVGSARLGQDTNLGEGSRFAAMVLGANFLGQSFLAESHPWSVVNRSVIGRDRLGQTNNNYQTSDGVWRN